MQVLIVEDDASIRRMIRKMLDREGYHVLEAVNGYYALKMLQKHSGIGLVITDIVMPEKEGLETIQEIKEMNPLTRIIAISGGGKIDAENYLVLARHLGADATLSKPFHKDDLLCILNDTGQVPASAG
ncbi:MAG: response regulator [candidate division KSB1 bacterium]|nr:response regulator [candidate division KSB1 bacterium]